jgi:hypothetical protein
MKNDIKYSRTCPNCGAEITYAYKSDLNKAIKRNSLCKHCAVSKSSIFQKGHNLNDKVVRNNSLDKLLDKSLQSMYWVGFLLADGSFYGNKFELGLSEKDKEFLEKFAEYIEFKNKIIYKESTHSYRVTFSNSKRNPIFMQEFGFNYSKTYNPTNFSLYEDLSYEQLLCFLIGIIDGDGHIEQNSSPNSFAIKITAHKVWKEFYEKLLTKLNIDIHIIERKESNCITIGIYKKEFINNFSNIIINNNLFILNRKWKQILEKMDPLAQEE